MQDTTYDVTFSPFRSFTRDEWSKLEEHPMFPVSDIDLSKLQALNEPLTMDEVEKIYIPMVAYSRYILLTIVISTTNAMNSLKI